MASKRPRHEGWSEYCALLPRERAQRREELEQLDNAEIAERFLNQSDYIARDVLIVRGIFDDTGSVSLNDCAHAILVTQAGAVRVHTPAGRGVFGHRGGVMFPGFRHYDVRAHRTDDARRSGHFGLPKPGAARYPDVAAVLFDTTCHLLGAWTIPRNIVERHRKPSGLPVSGAWLDDPDVVEIPVSDFAWINHGRG